MSYDEAGVRCMMMRGGTSRGLYVEARELPANTADRDALLLRLMGTPDPRQIDGLGGATSLTSKVAIVNHSDHPDAEVDYLFLQLGVEKATVTDRQNCGNILAGVGPFAVERGLASASLDKTSVRIRMVNSNSIAVATFPTPDGCVEYRGDLAIDGVPGTAAPVALAFTDTAGSICGSLLPTGNVHDRIDGIDATCVDNGMPVVIAMADSFGLTGGESHQQLAADTALLERIDAFRTEAGALMGLPDVSGSSIPKTVLLAASRDGGQLCTRSFIPVHPHTSIGVLAGISTVTGALLPDAIGHRLLARRPSDQSLVDIEHPAGHLLVDVSVDTTVTPPLIRRSGVVRTARKLFDGTAFPRG
jgi:4-oxalomesaconate tautomerase